MSKDDDLEVGEIAQHHDEDIFDNEESSTPNDVLQSNTSRKDFVAPALPDLEKKNQFELYSQKTLS